MFFYVMVKHVELKDPKIMSHKLQQEASVTWRNVIFMIPLIVTALYRKGK